MKKLILILALVATQAHADGLYLDLGITNSGSLFRADLDYESEKEAGAIVNVRYHWDKPFKKTFLKHTIFDVDSVDCGWFHESQWLYGAPFDDRSNEFDRDKIGCFASWKIWE